MQNILLAFSLLAAAPAAPAPAAVPPVLAAPALAPLAFFEGRSRSAGTLRVMFRSPRTILVESHGVLAADGLLTLTQRIDEQHKPLRTRIFRLREVSPGRYAGSLSDASGPVTGELHGNRLRLGYRMAGGLRVDQRIRFTAAGRVARSRISIYRMGMLAGTLDETIGRIEAAEARRTAP